MSTRTFCNSDPSQQLELVCCAQAPSDGTVSPESALAHQITKGQAREIMHRFMPVPEAVMHNHCAILLNIGTKHNQMLAQVNCLTALIWFSNNTPVAKSMLRSTCIRASIKPSSLSMCQGVDACLCSQYHSVLDMLSLTHVAHHTLHCHSHFCFDRHPAKLQRGIDQQAWLQSSSCWRFLWVHCLLQALLSTAHM